jgi:signal transduction histidine kinase
LKRVWAPSGLLGRVLAILLLTVLIEFGVSTFLYERATNFSVRDDEARRLAEHLVIGRRLLEERPAGERPAMAAELTTERYVLRWGREPQPRPTSAPALTAMKAQVTAWEPTLADTDLRMRLLSPGRNSLVAGELKLGDGTQLSFRTREPMTDPTLAFSRVLQALVPAVALMVLGGMLIRRTLLPLRRLSEAADTVGAGGRTAAPPVPEDGPGEVRRVVAAFNRMQARIGGLIADRTQALAAVGHDLRTPLARLRLRTDGIHDEEVRAAVSADIAEMDAMVASLLDFLGGDSDPEKPVRVDLAVLCATLVDDAIDREREAEYVGPDHCERVLRPIGMKRALANLVENALHYGETLTVTLLDAEEGVVIRVEDDGPGIPEDKLASAVQPFVRLDPARHRDTKGFGLGLAIVARAAAAEGGRLELSNREEGGLRAEIVLPSA